MDSLDKTFVKALFTQDYYRGYQELEIYVLNTILHIFHTMEISDYLHQDFRTVDEIIDRFSLHAQSGPFLQWACNYSKYFGYLEHKNDAYQLIGTIAGTRREENISRILQLTPTADIFINLIRIIETGIKDFFEGWVKGGDLLFADATIVNLWNSYFNNDFYGYAVVNHGIAYGITKWFSHTNGSSMLEVGSGTSGASAMTFQLLRDNNLLDSLHTIVLTDVVPSLQEKGRSNIKLQVTDPPRYEQRILDINSPVDDQGFSGETFDIIFGVNVLHVARDLSFSLQELRRHLNKDGMLILAETTRPAANRPMHHEFIFSLLENYHEVKLDLDTRPQHGFLTREQWLKNFNKAGFRNIEYLSELDHYDNISFDLKPLHSFLVLKGQK